MERQKSINWSVSGIKNIQKYESLRIACKCGSINSHIKKIKQSIHTPTYLTKHKIKISMYGKLMERVDPPKFNKIICSL